MHAVDHGLGELAEVTGYGGLTRQLELGTTRAEEALPAEEAILLGVDDDRRTQLGRRQLEAGKALCLDQQELHGIRLLLLRARAAGHAP